MQDLGLGGRVVLITGGGTGIGAATARVMAGSGAHPVVLGPDRQPLEAVASETGGVAVVGDAAEAACVQEAVARARERWGGVHVMVSCAGGGGMGAVQDMDDATWERGIRNNLTTAVVAVRECLTELVTHSGSAVIVSSRAGLSGPPRLSGYVTAKHALVGLVRSLAIDYGPSGVRVNAVCPGFVRTRMADAVMDRLAERRDVGREEAYGWATAPAPLRRAADPEELGRVIAFLASDWASAITGAILPVDCGWSAVDPAAVALDL